MVYTCEASADGFGLNTIVKTPKNHNIKILSNAHECWTRRASETITSLKN